MLKSVKKLLILVSAGVFCWSGALFAQGTNGIAVLETDFGLKDGAVSEVKGVMYSVNKSLTLSDLTHEIPPFNIWEASYRLYQTAPYWPKGTVFVSVIDPGVGTKRKSLVAESSDGHFFVTPDNGILTLIADNIGIKEVREIDETRNRLKGSLGSYTFYGRDVYGYTGARLASGVIKFEEVGPIYAGPLVKLNYQKPVISGNQLKGTIVVLDPQYGNLWTNISTESMQKFGIAPGHRFHIRITENNQVKYEGILPYQNTFGEVAKGAGLLYTNSLMNLALAINQGNFSQQHNIKPGAKTVIEIQKVN